uniref:Uncharacterized protein n=1 Tax=Meloidogyne enterolobii TaxID=390850 RepID=A0A6V7UPH9_MELEN|nr:unnamed protein product [Meloidogyne enterolobii]
MVLISPTCNSKKLSLFLSTFAFDQSLKLFAGSKLDSFLSTQLWPPLLEQKKKRKQKKN